MKAPLEQLESSTPMSASEVGAYILIGGAIFGVGMLAGFLKESRAKNERHDEALRNSRSDNRRETDRNTKQHQSRKTNPGDTK